MIADLFAIRFLLASAGCVAAGLAVWGALLLCRRRLPALAMQRSVWLAGQAVAALTFALLLAPQGGYMHVLPAFEVDVTPVVARATAAAPAGDVGAVQSAGADAPVLSLFAQAWMLVWALGVAVLLVRLWRGQRALARLTGLAEGTTARAADAPPIVEIDAPVAPMLVGLFQPCLLLPRMLRAGDPLQRELIVAHELAHWRRRDLWWLAASTVLQVLFWFNPAMRLLRTRLAWAQELGCDRDVLRSRPPAQRKAYAAALFAQLQAQRAMPRMPATALAFGGVDPDSLAARVALIRKPASAVHAGRARCAGLAALALAFGANLALQPALAWSNQPPRALDCTILLDATSGATLAEEGDCSVRTTPASTFNIAVSLMGYDSGFLRDAHTPALPFQPGYADWLPSWRATTDPTDWIRNSTVWYAQRVAAGIGAAGVGNYLRRFDYGNRDLSGGLQEAWIRSTLQISPREQAAFLGRLVRRELPVSAHAYDMTAQLLRLPDADNGWRVHGKTGTAYPLLADGGDDPDHAWGWFVGWASKEGRSVVFVRLLLDKRQQNRSAGPLAKEAFLRQLPARLDALHLPTT